MSAPSHPEASRALVYPSLERLPIDSPIRILYPDDVYPNGDYYRSPLGRVRYWIVGPLDGPKVSMIHGVSAPSLVFKHIVEELVKAGFRVLLYDIYGRGYSEAPKYTLSTEDYATQLALLMQHIAWSSTYVVGLSMGGGIASAFVATFPHLVNSKIVLIASAGLLDPGHFRRWNHEERNAQSQDAGVCAAKPPSYDKELKKV